VTKYNVRRTVCLRKLVWLFYWTKVMKLCLFEAAVAHRLNHKKSFWKRTKFLQNGI